MTLQNDARNLKIKIVIKSEFLAGDLSKDEKTFFNRKFDNIKATSFLTSDFIQLE